MRGECHIIQQYQGKQLSEHITGLYIEQLYKSLGNATKKP